MGTIPAASMKTLFNRSPQAASEAGLVAKHGGITLHEPT